MSVLSSIGSTYLQWLSPGELKKLDGPSHFVNRTPMGSTLLKWRLWIIMMIFVLYQCHMGVGRVWKGLCKEAWILTIFLLFQWIAVRKVQRSSRFASCLKLLWVVTGCLFSSSYYPTWPNYERSITRAYSTIALLNTLHSNAFADVDCQPVEEGMPSPLAWAQQVQLQDIEVEIPCLARQA